MGFGNRPAVRLAAVLAAAMAISNVPAAAATYDLLIYTYCVPGSLCGFKDMETYRQNVAGAVQELNLQWMPNGISFRPIIFDIEAQVVYAQVQGCNPNPPGMDFKPIRQDWREQVAADHPDAIAVMMTPGGSWCCTDPPNLPYGDPNNEDASPALFGVFCSTSFTGESLGAILAHELGHYFCLRHSFSFKDLVDNPPLPNWDPDTNYQVYDTPADASRFEGYDEDADGNPVAGVDADEDGTPIVGHQWCDVDEQTDVDSGSPHDTYCTPDCVTVAPGPDVEPFAQLQPMTRNVMSYHPNSCRGPFVLDGVRYESFTPDMTQEIQDCIATVPDRQSLVDVCASRFGDTDHDGICNLDDNCGGLMNTDQLDNDGDGAGNPCDLCPDNPNPTGDLDGDGLGDVCDDDRDGDNCLNAADQHPDQGATVSGSQFNQNCGTGLEPTYSWEGSDNDGDGQPGCHDYDDDNDGKCDDSVAHAADPSWGVPPGGCTAGPDVCSQQSGFGCLLQGAPAPCQPPWMVCYGGSCVEFFLKIVNAINPDPSTEVILDRFTISNRQIYVSRLPGRALTETAALFEGFTHQVTATAKSGGESALLDVTDPARLEIWSRRTGERVAIVGTFDPDTVVPGDLRRGSVLALTPSGGGASAPRLDIGASFAWHAPPGSIFSDADGDIIPCVRDNCPGVANARQFDGDGDGFGDACDADFDGDLVIGADDLAFLDSCVGATPRLQVPIAEPPDPDLMGADGPVPPSATLMEAFRCRAADLDGDGLVGAPDRAMAVARLGMPPGPSALAAAGAACPGGCDDGLACTLDWCEGSPGVCRHAPGSCDDGNSCTEDSCDTGSGACSHAPRSCDDGNDCTADACDIRTGECSGVEQPGGTPCSDGDLCTQGDQCVAGARCMPGTPTVCADGDACTLDRCVPATGQCAFPPACDDGNPCTADTCTPAGGGSCSHGAVADGTACSDGTACTAGDQCGGGVCRGTAVSCGDGNPCTSETCDPASGCLYAPLNCDDSDPCTQDSCVSGAAGGGCVNTPIVPASDAVIDFGAPILMAWSHSAGADHWNTYRGGIAGNGFLAAAGRVDWNHLCFESADGGGDGKRLTRDPFDPPIGTAWYYLVSGESLCGEGSLSEPGAVTARPNDSPCVTPP